MDDFEQFDHYQLLGVGRSATADELKRAYRQQMARYHPDRYGAAGEVERAYASRRAQRINEAYAALSDFSERAAYNRTLAGGGRPAVAPLRPAPSPAAPGPPRDHLAELYGQAQAHLSAERFLQAAATLREIQQLNPFYKDSAALLAQAESAARQAGAAPARPAPPPPASAPDRGRRALVTGGLGVLALAGLGAAGWAMRGRAAALTGVAPTAPLAASAVAEPGVASAPPASTGGPAAQPSATVAPTAAPTAAPPPTAPPAPTQSAPQPTLAPTAAPTAPPPPPTAVTVAEEGLLLYADEFGARRGWPTLSGTGWSVGFAGGGYRITASDGAGNIWAYGTAPDSPDFLVGVDTKVSGGLGGLLLRYSAGGYLAFFVNPELGSYRLERRAGGRGEVLVEEGQAAVLTGAEAVNRLVARLAGDSLALRINGQPVYELSVDRPPPSAQYGMIAVARGDGVVADFTNLTVRSL